MKKNVLISCTFIDELLQLFSVFNYRYATHARKMKERLMRNYYLSVLYVCTLCT